MLSRRPRQGPEGGRSRSKIGTSWCPPAPPAAIVATEPGVLATDVQHHRHWAEPAGDVAGIGRRRLYDRSAEDDVSILSGLACGSENWREFGNDCGATR